jgi:hypothetical protein
MVNEANPLDEFLQSTANEASFPFNEDHWKRMEARLDEETPKQKRRFFLPWWKGVALSVLGIGIGMAFWKWPQTPHTKTLTETNVSLIVTEPIAQAPTTPQTDTTSLQPSITHNEVSKKNIDNENGTSTTKSVTLENKPSTPATSMVANTNEDPAQVLSSKKYNIAANTNASPTINFVSEKGSLPNNLYTAQTAQLIQGKPMQAIDTQVQTHHKPMSEEEMIRYNPRYRAALQQYIPERNDSITIIRFKPIQEPTSVYNPMASDSLIANYRLQLFLGSILWRGFIGGNTWSPAPYMGIGLEKTISKRLTMATQVGFTFFAGLQTQNRSVSYRYKFGVDSLVYTALHRMVFRIQWPVQLRYAFNKKHAAMLGAGAAWQPDGLSKVTAPQQVLNGGSVPSGNPPLITKNTLGYLHGIRAWDLFFQAGYQWQWHERMALHVLWQAGLRDMTDNKILSSNRIQRNNGLMLGLRYSFVRSNRK